MTAKVVIKIHLKYLIIFFGLMMFACGIPTPQKTSDTTTKINAPYRTPDIR